VVIPGGWLTLRPWRGDDISFVFDACQDAEIRRWTTVPSPYRARHAVDFLRLGDEARRTGTGEWLAIEATDTSELLGSIAIRGLLDGHAEVGYWVAPECRHRGVASGAVEALVAWAFETLDLDEVILHVARGNEASVSVARRCGFEPIGMKPDALEVDGEVRDAMVFRRRAPGRSGRL
jgi:RimJ/RimL family protein N-acetyltransferase